MPRAGPLDAVGHRLPLADRAPAGTLVGVATRIRSALASGGEGGALAVFSGRRTTARSLRRVLSLRDLRLLERCGLLDDDGAALSSPFRAHLVDGLLVITDPDVPEERQAATYLDPLWEAPYLARLLVRGRARTALDVGCGCGVLALVLAGFAARVAAVDINARAVAVARFNARWNGVRNVDFVQGDLVEPLARVGFDRIVFNSPTDDEGAHARSLLHAGEGILARFFAELPRRLATGGFAQVNLAMHPGGGRPFRDRLWSWIGDPVEAAALVLPAAPGTRPSWRRGWLTLRHGPRRWVEEVCHYDRLARALAPQDGDAWVRRLFRGPATAPPIDEQGRPT